MGCIFWDEPAKCEVAHISLPFSPSKVRHGDIYLAPGGERDGGDYPSDHDVGGPRLGCADSGDGRDLPASTFEFVLKGRQAALRNEGPGGSN